jgi:hypothetical protein
MNIVTRFSDIQLAELEKLEKLFAVIRWELSFALALNQRQVLRLAPEGSGTRFVCTDEGGNLYCEPEEIEPGQQLDLLDVVPKNRAADLENLLVTASDSRGVLSKEYWELLRRDLLSLGAEERQFERLEAHRQRDALGAFFVGVELALDLQSLPPLQWRNGVDEHGSPRF